MEGYQLNMLIMSLSISLRIYVPSVFHAIDLDCLSSLETLVSHWQTIARCRKRMKEGNGCFNWMGTVKSCLKSCLQGNGRQPICLEGGGVLNKHLSRGCGAVSIHEKFCLGGLAVLDTLWTQS